MSALTSTSCRVPLTVREIMESPVRAWELAAQGLGLKAQGSRLKASKEEFTAVTGRLERIVGRPGACAVPSASLHIAENRKFLTRPFDSVISVWSEMTDKSGLISFQR